MPTVKLSKHPGRNEIQATPPSVVVKSNDTLTFEVSAEHGFDAGTVVTVTFAEEFRIGGTEVRRPGRGRGPFRHNEGDASNPERGRFEFSDAKSFTCGEVDDAPEPGEAARVWKYDVTWTGLPDLDPRVKIERGN